MQTDTNPVSPARCSMPSDHNVWIQILNLRKQVDELAAEIRSLKESVLELVMFKDKTVTTPEEM